MKNEKSSQLFQLKSFFLYFVFISFSESEQHNGNSIFFFYPIKCSCFQHMFTCNKDSQNLFCTEILKLFLVYLTFFLSSTKLFFMLWRSDGGTFFNTIFRIKWNNEIFCDLIKVLNNYLILLFNIKVRF